MGSHPPREDYFVSSSTLVYQIKNDFLAVGGTQYFSLFLQPLSNIFVMVQVICFFRQADLNAIKL